MREREINPELLGSADEDAAQANRRDLHRINSWFGGYEIARRGVREFFRRGQGLRILDVGAAWGDLARHLGNEFPGASVTSCDIHAGHLAWAACPKVCADAFRLPFRKESFDIVICSLFLHHFQAGEVVALLGEMNRVALRGVVAVDLERHGMAQRFLPATRALFGWHAVTLHDGPVSVAAGFSRGELAALAETAGLSGARIRRHLPWFRLSLVHRRTPPGIPPNGHTDPRRLLPGRT